MFKFLERGLPQSRRSVRSVPIGTYELSFIHSTNMYGAPAVSQAWF